jgi:hypothetical protein
MYAIVCYCGVSLTRFLVDMVYNGKIARITKVQPAPEYAMISRLVLIAAQPGDIYKALSNQQPEHLVFREHEEYGYPSITGVYRLGCQCQGYGNSSQTTSTA